MRTSTRSGARNHLKPYMTYLIFCLAGMLLAGAVFAGIGSFIGGAADENTRNALAIAERDELNGAFDVFATIGYPNADIHGDVIPRLKIYFHSAETLDNLVVSLYGPEYSLLDAELYRYITLTFDEIEAAAAQGESIDSGIENLRVYMLLLQEQVAVRFDANGVILPLSN